MLSSSDSVGAQVVVLLGVVPDRDVVPVVEETEIGGGLAGEDAQQAGLAGAVEAEHEQALAAAEVEVDVLEHRRSAVALAQPVRPDHRLTRRRRVGEAHRHLLVAALFAHPIGFEAGDALLHAVGERRLRRLGAEAVDERLQAGDLLGLQGGLLGETAFVLGPRRAVLAVRALVLGDVTDGVLGRAVEVQHAGDGLVEQFEVVADDEQRPAVLPEEPHQPLLGVDVEVVRRLVEAQHVAAGEQDPGQLDPPALAARQHADREVDAVLVDPQPGRHRPRLALGRVSAAHAEHLLGARVAVDVALVGSLLHLEPELLDPFQLLVDAAARQHVGHGGAAVEDTCDAGILWQVAEPALADHPPGGRFDGAAEHPEQARLAGTVAADDADLVAGHDGEAGRLDDESAADLHRELLRL